MSSWLHMEASGKASGDHARRRACAKSITARKKGLEAPRPEARGAGAHRQEARGAAVKREKMRQRPMEPRARAPNRASPRASRGQGLGVHCLPRSRRFRWTSRRRSHARALTLEIHAIHSADKEHPVGANNGATRARKASKLSARNQKTALSAKTNTARTWLQS